MQDCPADRVLGRFCIKETRNHMEKRVIELYMLCLVIPSMCVSTRGCFTYAAHHSSEENLKCLTLMKMLGELTGQRAAILQSFLQVISGLCHQPLV